MKKVVLLLSFIGIVSLSSAQKYDFAVGLRLGYPYGITGKLFLSESLAADVTLLSNGHYLGAVGLLELQKKSTSQPNWDWYYGAGAHATLDLFDGTGMSVGLDGIVGAEYVFKDMPLAISFDWIPSFNLIKPEGDGGFIFWQFGVGIRYLL